MKRIKKTRTEAKRLELAANVKVRWKNNREETKETKAANRRKARMQRLAMTQTVLLASKRHNTRLWDAILRMNGWDK